MNQIIEGNCIDVMKGFEENTIDCIATDPPYGISMMGKEWDKALPPKEAFIQMIRVLKPGALAFVMSSPRQDVMWRMGELLETSGFSLKQSFMSWIYNSGFPKSFDISKNIDKKLGLERTKISDNPNSRPNCSPDNTLYEFGSTGKIGEITAPASDLAKKWSGWKSVTGLKPALEVIFMVQKPLSEPTIVDNVLKWGTGAMNVDGCRIPLNGKNTQPFQFKARSTNVYGEQGRVDAPEDREQNEKGRFPANILVSDDALNDGKKTISHIIPEGTPNDLGKQGIYNDFNVITNERGFDDEGSSSRYFDLDAWAEHNGIIQVPKASSGERDEGLTGENNKCGTLKGENIHKYPERKNIHPCVKPVKLMAYLITLGCPKNGVVLDPFVGSGTTCVAAKRLGRKWIGIELDPEYFKIAKNRVEAEFEWLDNIFI